MTFQLVYIFPHQLQLEWSELAPIVERATNFTRGHYVAADVLIEALQARFQVWAIKDEAGTTVAALITTVVSYPRTRVLEVVFLSGTRGLEWGPKMIEMVEALARSAGCSRIEFKGRKEWERVLAPYGYSAVAVSYEKVLQPCADSGVTLPVVASPPS